MRHHKGCDIGCNAGRKRIFAEKRLKSFGDKKLISIFAIPNQERHLSRGGKTMPM
jgi:hypothetical protein